MWTSTPLFLVVFAIIFKNNIYLKGVPDVFIEHGTVEELHESIGLDTKNLTEFILDKLD